MNSYFSSQMFSEKEAKFLFKVRSEMLNVKKNFSHFYKNDKDELFCQHCPVNTVQSQNAKPSKPLI